MTRQFFLGVVAALAAACSLSTAEAGAIFFAGKLEKDKFVAADAKQPCYTVRYCTVTAAVNGDAVTVKTQETIAGPEAAVQTLCLIPLPEGGDVKNAIVSVSTADGERVLSGVRLLSSTKAQKLYETLAAGLGSVKVLALSGRPALLLPQFELRGKVELTVQYETKVQRYEGTQRLACPMPRADWAAGPVERVSLTATLETGEPLRAVFSPSHTAAVEREGLHKAAVRVRADSQTGSQDFRLCWVADKDDLGLRLLPYRSEDDEDGYFLLVGNPTGRAGAEKSIDKDVIFVLDTSGSMRGEKIEQARSAIEYCLGQLNPGDRFNIVTFGTGVTSFRDAPVPRSAETLAAASEFVEDIVAKGLTNISGALSRALASQPQKGRPRIMIFLTDGTPTSGEMSPEKIVAGVKEANTSQTRVFVVGVGHDVNVHLLDKLAEATDGSSEYIAPQEEIDAKVAALYDRLSRPVLTNVAVEWGELRTHSVYPQKLPALFRGSDVMMFGRYRGGGRHTLSLSGTLAGETVRYTCAADLPAKSEGKLNEFVAPLWAARKIGFLLQEIRLHGGNEELVAEVVRLSKRFGIMTEYTEFAAVMATDAHAAMDAVKKHLGEARAQQAGQWAFNQARNDRELQQRLVANPGAAVYLDRRGRALGNEGVTQIGERVFYLRDGQWVDGAEAGARKTRVVKLFSPEYHEMVRNHRDFARAQQLGWAIEMNVGGERIVVERDGQQKSDELRARHQDLQRNMELRHQNIDLRQQQMRDVQQQLQQAPRNQVPNLQIDQRLNQRNQ
jgi:Ca-activated chloride channel family protein